MKKFLIGIVALAVVIAGGIAIALATIDADKYRPQIVAALEKQTGRAIKLNGPIKFGLSLHGAVAGIRDAAIGNPAWASRPDMADIGRFELGVALLPLLDHRLQITELKIENADIQLETAPDGRHNWDFAPTPQPANGSATPASGASSGAAAGVSVDRISVKDSQLTIRGKNGKSSVFKVTNLDFGIEGGGLAAHFAGAYNGAPITLDVKTGAQDFTSGGDWPFDADLTYADYRAKAKGDADIGRKTAAISSYDITAGKSDLHGNLTADWSGAAPVLKGTLLGSQFDPADFKPDEKAAGGGGKPGEAPASGPKRIFSTAPLPLDSLKSANATLDIALDNVTLGSAALKNVTGKLTLDDGRLSLPLKATLGGAPVTAAITLNGAAAPAQFSMSFAAPGVDLADLMHMGDMSAFLSGKADTTMNIASSGDSLHELASNANGKLDVIADGGTVSGGAASAVSSSLADLIAPGGTNALNCLAARFNIANGVVKDNGILLDTVASTVAGKGGVNLGEETVDMSLRARTKLVNVASVLPPLHIGGTLAKPKFRIDPTAVVRNIAGILTSASLDGGVPTMLSPPQGQNACVYTLDHPQAAAAQDNMLQNAAGNASGQIKKLGGKLLKGLFGQ